MSFFEIHNLDVFYGGLQALFSVSIRIEQGEFVSILGPNGAGKSTLLQTISGIQKPKNGDIILEGTSVHRLAPHEIVEMGIVLIPEEGWLYPEMNVRENLLMGAYAKTARNKTQQRLDFVFNIFPILKERQAQLAETLSGGERQMLAIGRGLMSNPKLLMLDEPSLGLAPLIVKDILSTLHDINRRDSLTIILTEQNIFHALKISHRGYILENGSITLSGHSAELLNNEHIKKNYLGL